jgi:HEAT repeat protein
LPRSLAEAVASAPADERELADLRRQLDDDVEAAARSQDYQERAIAFRAIGQLRFNQKTELLRRGLDDASPAVRGSALLSLELLSRNHPGLVNSARPRLHSLLTEDGNQAVRRLAVLCLKNGSPQADTLTLLAHVADDDEDANLRAAATAVLRGLKLKSSARR